MNMKKYLTPSLILLALMSLGLLSNSVLPAQAATKIVPKVAVKAAPVKKVVVVVTKVTWAASGKQELAKIKNSAVRAAYKTKVEKYATRNKIKSITSAVVKGMRE